MIIILISFIKVIENIVYFAIVINFNNIKIEIICYFN